MFVCVDDSPKATTISCAQCCGVDTALLWHPVGVVLPPFHAALQKQQVVCKVKHSINT